MVLSAGAIEYIDFISAEGKTPPREESPENSIKSSDGEAPVMPELWGMQKNLLLPLLPGSLETGLVVPERVSSMGQIEQTMNVNKWLMLNYDCYIAILETI